MLKATAAQFPQPEGEGSPEVERPQDIQPQAPAPHLSAAEITAAALSPRDGQPSPRPYVRTYLSPAEMAAAAAAAVPEEEPTEEPTEEPAESEWHPPEPEPEPEMLTSSETRSKKSAIVWGSKPFGEQLVARQSDPSICIDDSTCSQRGSSNARSPRSGSCWASAALASREESGPPQKHAQTHNNASTT